MKCEQLCLPLDCTASFREYLRDAPCEGLSVRVSSRLKNGWYVSYRRSPPTRLLVIPAFLDSAPTPVKEALLDWARLPPARRAAPATRRRRKQLENTVWSYVASLPAEPSRTRTVDPGRIEARTRGINYDLREVFDTLNRACFGSRLASLIRWGAPSSTTSYQSNRRDTSGTEVSLITIAGAYDHPNVPRFAIEGVVHHEMLHIVHPPYSKNGRRVIHGPEFRKSEKAFPAWHQWRSWESRHLRRLAGAKKRMRNSLRRRA